MSYKIDYIKTILNENYAANMGELSFGEWLDLELANSPESFDCFFDKAWDELNTNRRRQRIYLIKNLF